MTFSTLAAGRQRAGPLLIAALALLYPAGAGAVEPEELVAAFVYKFTHFVTWPDSAHDTGRSICLVDADTALTHAVESVAGPKQIRVRPVSDASQAEGCSVLLSGSLGSGSVKLAAELAERPVLTVSTVGNFAAQGGMIELRWSGPKLRFAINHAAAKRAGLRMSSKLLQLAETVHEGD